MATGYSRRVFLTGTAVSAAVLHLSQNAARADTPTVHEVRISSFAFDPKHLEVSVGDTIRWTNEDLAPHTATADAFGWDTELLARGDSAEITVQDGMETSYFCVFHPHMKGTIKIT